MGGLDAEREVIDIVRVIRLGKTDTVMSCLGDRFRDACVLVNALASSWWRFRDRGYKLDSIFQPKLPLRTTRTQ